MCRTTVFFAYIRVLAGVLTGTVLETRVVIDSNDSKDLATRQAAALEAQVHDDLADLRTKLVRGPGGESVLFEGAAALAELEESICRLVSELKASSEPCNQSGTTHG